MSEFETAVRTPLHIVSLSTLTPSQSAAARALLPPAEDRAVLKYYFVRDAAMSLASHLLKHLAITELCRVPWPLSAVTREPNGKPCYSSSASASAPRTPLAFNVSHQAGLVPLIACATADLDVGIDVVCVDERPDTAAAIAADGLFAWIDLHADVFAPAELAHLKHDVAHLALAAPLPPAARAAAARCQRPADDAFALAPAVVHAKLRRFYALWCLREAYVKMTGEALLAPWLRALEFRAFAVPAPAAAAAAAGPGAAELAWGETRTDFEIYFRGERVSGLGMEIRALGSGYMVASAVRRRDGGVGVPEFPGFEMVGLERIFGAAREG